MVLGEGAGACHPGDQQGDLHVGGVRQSRRAVDRRGRSRDARGGTGRHQHDGGHGGAVGQRVQHVRLLGALPGEQEGQAHRTARARCTRRGPCGVLTRTSRLVESSSGSAIAPVRVSTWQSTRAFSRSKCSCNAVSRFSTVERELRRPHQKIEIAVLRRGRRPGGQLEADAARRSPRHLDFDEERPDRLQRHDSRDLVAGGGVDIGEIFRSDQPADVLRGDAPRMALRIGRFRGCRPRCAHRAPLPAGPPPTGWPSARDGPTTVRRQATRRLPRRTA